jgi:hypothetical protein
VLSKEAPTELGEKPDLRETMLTRLALVAFGLSAVFAAVWVLFFHHPAAAEQHQRQAAKPGIFGYLYCKQCGFEITCAEGRENIVTRCPRCWAKTGSVLEFSKSSRTSGGVFVPPPSPVLPVTLIGATILMGVTLLCAARLTKKKQHRRTIRDLCYTCQICRRRMRYAKEQAGHKARCPKCKNLFTFPVAFKAVKR